MRIREIAKGGLCLVGRTALLLIAVLLLPGAPEAANVTVDCDGGPADFPTITDALNALDAAGPHTITVTGTCEEAVIIFSRQGVTIEAPEGETATVMPPPAIGVVFLVRGVKAIFLRRLVIRGASIGLSVHDASVKLEDCTVQDNSSFGLFVTGNSFVTFSGESAIRDNGGTGVLAFESIVWFVGSDPVVIEGHRRAGVIATFQSEAALIGPHRVSNNGSADGSSVGGIVGERSSVLDIEGTAAGGPEISNNVGPGVAVDINSSLALGGATISHNTGEGVRVRRLSVADFFSPNTIVGNGVANISCDSTSLLVGNLAGIGNISCNRIERELGPPRPGRIIDLPPQP